MFESIVLEYREIKLTLCLVDREDLSITTSKVHVLQEALQLLKPFEQATREVSFEDYISPSKVIPLARSLQSLTQLSPSTLPVEGELLSNMAGKFINLEGNYLLTVSALLDPRFRKSAVNHLNIKVQKKSLVKKSQKQMLNNPVLLQIILLSHLQSSKLLIQSQVAYGPLLIVELQSFLQITTHYSQSL